MLVAGIPQQPTEHGKYGPRSLCSLINYLAELSWENVTGLVSPTMCNCLMWQGGGYVVPL